MPGSLILLCLMSIMPVSAQILLSEIMFDAAGPERSDEFVEIYNAGIDEVDLASWQIGDGQGWDNIIAAPGGETKIAPGQYGLILDPDYWQDSSAAYDHLIPLSALILTIDGSTIGSSGLSNSSAETVSLVDIDLDTVQHYTYTLDNQPGHSDERIDVPLAGKLWANSLDELGTPGAGNSVTPRQIDLAMIDLLAESGTVLSGSPLEIQAILANLGREVVERFELSLFFDVDRNGLGGSTEIIEILEIETPFPAGDTLTLPLIFDDPGFGEQFPGVTVSSEGDESLQNNSRVLAIFVEDPNSIDITINEVMFEPRGGFGEWVELYNRGTEPLDLRPLRFADSRDTVEFGPEAPLLAPGNYLVIGGDSALIGQYDLPPGAYLNVGGFPTLNNDADNLRLLGPSGFVYDRVQYTDLWYHRQVDPGTSIEKFNPQFDGKLSANWSASVAAGGSTPAAGNSVLLNVLAPQNRLSVTPNPFSPDVDGIEDVAVIQYDLGIEAGFARVRIFDLRGRTIRMLARDEPVASRGQFIWDGKDEQDRVGPVGAYICLFELLDTHRQVYDALKETIILIKK